MVGWCMSQARLGYRLKQTSPRCQGPPARVARSDTGRYIKWKFQINYEKNVQDKNVHNFRYKYVTGDIWGILSPVPVVIALDPGWWGSSTGAAPLTLTLPIRTDKHHVTHVRNEPHSQAQIGVAGKTNVPPGGAPVPLGHHGVCTAYGGLDGLLDAITWLHSGTWPFGERFQSFVIRWGEPRKPHRSSCDQALKRVAKL